MVASTRHVARIGPVAHELAAHQILGNHALNIEMRRGDLRGRVAPLASTRDPLCDRMEHACVPRSRQARSCRVRTGCAVVRYPEARPTCSWRGRPLPIARPTARRPCSFVRSCHGRSNGDNEGSKRLRAGNWRHSFHGCRRYPCFASAATPPCIPLCISS